MDKASAIELLEFILESIRLIKGRFKVISSADSFLDNDENIEKLDSISMRLQSIGEALKNLYKRENELLLKAGSKDYWSEVIKTRDFISHHYIDLDAEIVFDICKNELQTLESKIIEIKKIINS